ncbi:MAG: hypothetical protein M0Z58_00035 [Nitrospiraceae bacterium]|nr:hypothetical protein [Nitrospiraceae bacterium]
MSERKENEIPIVSYRTFFYIWIALLVLLAITVAVAVMNAAHALGLNLLIAFLMAWLDLFFFMNLRHERLFLKIIILLPIFAYISIIVLTYSDAFYRMAG